MLIGLRVNQLSLPSNNQLLLSYVMMLLPFVIKLLVYFAEKLCSEADGSLSLYAC